VNVFGAAGYRFGELAAYVRSNCESDAHRLDPKATLQFSSKLFAAGRAAVCSTHVKVPANGITLAAFNRSYGFLHEGRSVIVAFQSLDRVAAAKTPVFVRIVDSMRFE
jgi:hypothetical protein